MPRRKVREGAHNRLAAEGEGVLHVKIELVELELGNGADDALQVVLRGNRPARHIHLRPAIDQGWPIWHACSQDNSFGALTHHELPKRLKAL